MKKHTAVADGVESLAAQFSSEADGVGRVRECVEGQSTAGGAAARKSACRRTCRGVLHPHWQCSRRHVCSAVGRGVRHSSGRFSGSVSQRLVGWMSGRSHETHGRRDLGLRGRRAVATDEPGLDCLWRCVRLWSLDRAAVARRRCTVLYTDTCAVLHTDTGKPRRGEGEGEGEGGQRGTCLRTLRKSTHWWKNIIV